MAQPMKELVRKGSPMVSPAKLTSREGKGIMVEALDHNEASSYPTGAGSQLIVHTADTTDDEFVAEMQEADESVLAGILRKAKACALKKSFMSERKTLKRAGLTKSRFSKLKKIGETSRFYETNIAPHLPPAESILYEMALLNIDKLETAIANGTICPTVKRTQIQNLREGKPLDQPRDRGGKKPFVSLVERSALGDQDREELRRRLEAACEGFDVEIRFAGEAGQSPPSPRPSSQRQPAPKAKAKAANSAPKHLSTEMTVDFYK